MSLWEHQVIDVPSLEHLKNRTLIDLSFVQYTCIIFSFVFLRVIIIHIAGVDHD